MDRVGLLSTARKLVGMRLVAAAHAADLRGFGFIPVQGYSGANTAEWWLHIQCSWRLQTTEQVITGSFDWYQPATSEYSSSGEWDPARGGSLQELKLRELFLDNDTSKRTIANNGKTLIVEAAEVDRYGGLALQFSGGVQLHVFPAGARGEFWRIFKKGDFDSHAVSEA